MSRSHVRDFVGYGPNQPDPKWPDRARLAINFVINVEEGSGPSVEDGEGFTEVQHTEAYGRSQGVNGRDLAGEGMFEYGSRVGFWRILRLSQDRNLPLTAFAVRWRLSATHRLRLRSGSRLLTCVVTDGDGSSITSSRKRKSVTTSSALSSPSRRRPASARRVGTAGMDRV